MLQTIIYNHMKYKKFDELFEKAQDNIYSAWDKILKKIDLNHDMTKKGDSFIYSLEMPGHDKENIRVKNFKDDGKIEISSKTLDPIDLKSYSFEYSYTYNKSLILKETKYERGILYLIFEKYSSSKEAEDVKVS